MHTGRHKWVAALTFQGKHHWCGEHSLEIDAAHAINKKCDELGIPRRNPGIADPPMLASDSQVSEEKAPKIGVNEKSVSDTKIINTTQASSDDDEV